MAKNKPVPKNIPQPRTPQSGVRSTTKAKASGGGFFRIPTSQNKQLLFDKTNYLLFAFGGLLIILGFILMSGGNQDPKVFNVAEIYSFRRITLAPITVVAGLAVIILAILKKPSTTPEA